MLVGINYSKKRQNMRVAFPEQLYHCIVVSCSQLIKSKLSQATGPSSWEWGVGWDEGEIQCRRPRLTFVLHSVRHRLPQLVLHVQVHGFPGASDRHVGEPGRELKAVRWATFDEDWFVAGAHLTSAWKKERVNSGWMDGLENSFILQIKLIMTSSESVLSRENKKI